MSRSANQVITTYKGVLHAWSILETFNSSSKVSDTYHNYDALYVD